jgi:hypothetical protein
MAISVVQSDMAHANGASQVQVAFTGVSKPAAGSLLVAFVSVYDETSPYDYAISDSQSNSWTEVYDNNYVGNYVGGIAYAENVANANTTVTVTTSSGSYLTLVLVEVSGIKTSTSLDQSNQNNASSGSTWDSGNITTTENDEILFGMVTHENGNISLTEDGAFTVLQEEEDGATNMPINAHYRIVSSTLTESSSGTLGSSIYDWWSGIASFEAEAGVAALTVNVSDGVTVGESVTVSLPDALTASVTEAVTVGESVLMFLMTLQPAKR